MCGYATQANRKVQRKSIRNLRLWLFLAVFLIYLLAQLISPIAPMVAQTAVVCPDVGRDGGGTVGGIVNTYYQPASTSTLNAGQTSFNLGTLSPIGAGTPVSVGDLILIMQMQGADANYTNTSAYGNGVGGYEPPTTYPNGMGASSGIPPPPPTAGSGYTNINNTGLYEYAIVTGVSGSTVTIQGGGAGGGLINTYINAPATAT